LYLTQEVVEVTIDVRKQRKLKIPNAVIAATTLVYDFTLLTRNTADFKSVKGIKIVNPGSQYKVLSIQ
jgi:predicted nucleic acid-binding protein